MNDNFQPPKDSQHPAHKHKVLDSNVASQIKMEQAELSALKSGKKISPALEMAEAKAEAAKPMKGC